VNDIDMNRESALFVQRSGQQDGAGIEFVLPGWMTHLTGNEDDFRLRIIGGGTGQTAQRRQQQEKRSGSEHVGTPGSLVSGMSLIAILYRHGLHLATVRLLFGVTDGYNLVGIRPVSA
jgi:hypothetical protein